MVTLDNLKLGYFHRSSPLRTLAITDTVPMPVSAITRVIFYYLLLLLLLLLIITTIIHEEGSIALIAMHLH